MKTLEEKAEEYSKKVSNGKHYSDLEIGFLAGYKAALEWISADDEFPENETYINLKFKNGDIGSMFFETNADMKYIKRYCTHWRPIN